MTTTHKHRSLWSRLGIGAVCNHFVAEPRPQEAEIASLILTPDS